MAEPGDATPKVDVIIGDDWTATDDGAAGRSRRGGLITLNRSPLARKIITFNLTALIVLVAGMLYLTPSRDNLAFQRAGSLVAEAELIADIIESRLPQGAPVSLATGDGFDVATALDGIDLRGGIVVALYDPSGRLITQTTAADAPDIPGLSEFDSGGTLITDTLNALWDSVARTLDTGTTVPDAASEAPGQDLVVRALASGTLIEGMNAATGAGQFIVARRSSTTGAPLAPSPSSPRRRTRPARPRRTRTDAADVRRRRPRLHRSQPGSRLDHRQSHRRPCRRRRTRPRPQRPPHGAGPHPDSDLTARPDEIDASPGPCAAWSRALRPHRIERTVRRRCRARDQEPPRLAALRRGHMRVAKRDDQREKLLDIIDHDVRRLDRLVSDIASASRLDSELVKEEEKRFDLPDGRQPERISRQGSRRQGDRLHR